MTAARHARILRTIPLLIAICFVSLPVYAKCAGSSRPPGNPYEITTAADLILLGESPEDCGRVDAAGRIRMDLAGSAIPPSSCDLTMPVGLHQLRERPR